MGREGSGGRFPFLVTNSPPAVWCSGPTGLPAHRVLCGHAWGLPSRTPSWLLSPQHTPLKQGLTARAMAMGLASFSQGVVEVQRGERAGERALSCLQVASSQGLLPARRQIQGDECGPFLFPSFFFPLWNTRPLPKTYPAQSNIRWWLLSHSLCEWKQWNYTHVLAANPLVFRRGEPSAGLLFSCFLFLDLHCF